MLRSRLVVVCLALAPCACEEREPRSSHRESTEASPTLAPSQIESAPWIERNEDGTYSWDPDAHCNEFRAAGRKPAARPPLTAVKDARARQQGKSIRVEPLGLRGEINLVAVWTAWCAPCRDEMPRLERLVREYGGRGLSVAGLAVLIPEEFEVDAVRRFVAEAGISFPIFLVDEDSYDRLEAVARETGGPGLVLPTVFATDRQARILEVFRGRDAESLQAALARWFPPGD